MIPLLGELPETVTANGVDYAVYTDFLSWMEFDQLLRDKEMEDSEKLSFMLSWYRDESPPDLQMALDGLIWFYHRGQGEKPAKSGGSQKQSRILDFEQDAPLIYAAFLHAYRLDLCDPDVELHWWQFMALMDYLPDDSKLAQVMSIRGTDVNKLSKYEKERIRKLKEIYALKDNGSGVKPKTLEERNAMLLAKAQQARERTKNNV